MSLELIYFFLTQSCESPNILIIIYYDHPDNRAPNQTTIDGKNLTLRKFSQIHTSDIPIKPPLQCIDCKRKNWTLGKFSQIHT